MVNNISIFFRIEVILFIYVYSHHLEFAITSFKNNTFLSLFDYPPYR